MKKALVLVLLSVLVAGCMIATQNKTVAVPAMDRLAIMEVIATLGKEKGFDVSRFDVEQGIVEFGPFQEWPRTVLRNVGRVEVLPGRIEITFRQAGVLPVIAGALAEDFAAELARRLGGTPVALR